MINICEWAKLEALFGLRVFPCRSDKTPACPNGFKDATCNPEEVEALFSTQNASAIGVPTGQVNGIVAIDIDVKKGKNGLDWYWKNQHRLPNTKQHLTPSGGLHLVYRVLPDTIILNSASKIAEGVDVRGDGGYVLWPPSPGYVVSQDNEISLLPGWLVLTIGSSGTKSPRGHRVAPLITLDDDAAINLAREYARNAPPAIEGAGGDAHTYRIACHMRDLGVSEKTSLSILYNEWNGRCVPPWEFDGLADKVANAYRYGQNAPGTRHPAADFNNLPSFALPAVLGGAGDMACAVARLAALPDIDYAQLRAAEAKQLGVRVSDLDKAVRKERMTADDSKQAQVRRLEIANPPRWASPVDGKVLLEELCTFFSRHLSLPSGGKTILALWAIHTHCYDVFRHTPRLAVRSPEKGCGKTTVLDLLELVVARPLAAANVTPAATFRAIESANPTLLIDEADTFLARSQELRGVLNAGHKRGGQVVRCVGDDHEPSAFAVFAPAAIAAIGSLPSTIHDRSITLMMKRAIGTERPMPITRETEAAGHRLASQAARWVADNVTELGKAVADLPDVLANRKADNWRPLMAIGLVAGGDWLTAAIQLASASASDDDDAGLLAMLLADLKAIFTEAKEDRLSTAYLVNRLIEKEDRPWPEMPNTNKALSSHRLTRLLKTVGATRKQWRSGNLGARDWGFYRTDLEDAFARYA
jgi:hypothetical protein